MYRAYCDECAWIADQLHEDEDDAYADLDWHVAAQHVPVGGVKREPEPVVSEGATR